MKHKDEEKQKAEVTISEEEYAKLKEDSSKKSEYWDKFLRQQAEFEVQ